MTEISLDTVIQEQDFSVQLGSIGRKFAHLANELLTVTSERSGSWRKRDHFQVNAEADELESQLDDFGARYNRTFCYLTELTASIRGISLAGLSIAHLSKRLEAYGFIEVLGAEEATRAAEGIERARSFIQNSVSALLAEWLAEARRLAIDFGSLVSGSEDFERETTRLRLPRNVDLEEIQDEELRIAEVASKYLEAGAMLREAGFESAGSKDRAALLKDACSEVVARVYEATIHNLQSAYDTHIGNTVLESNDERLRRLRGHISGALHLFEATTQLTHFVERHESGERSDSVQEKLAAIVAREDVEELILDVLLHWSCRFMSSGMSLAEELLPSYTNMGTLEVVLADDLILHARPASLIVAIVNHHGTPVELEIAGKTCNASSILELMVLVGSNTDERRFVFRGDERPLGDIQLLFESEVGERGMDKLPDELSYLRL